MASPAIESALATANAASGTAFVVSYPATVSAGSTLICWVSTNAATVTFPAGWTKLSGTDYTGTSGDRANVAWRKAAGSEGGTTFTITQSVGVKAAACVWSITGATDPTVTPPEVGTVATGSGSNAPDPPSVTPTGGTKDYLFLALAHGEGALTVTVWPDNYILNQISQGTSGGSAGSNVRTAGAGRQRTGFSFDDPTQYNYSGTTPWIAQTVAIYPAPPSGTAWTATPADSVTMSDGQSFVSGKGVTPADSVTMSDGLASQAAFQRTFTDTASLADAVALGVGEALADTVTLSDLVAPQAGKQATPADTVTVTDTVRLDIGETLTDAVALADAVSFGVGLILTDTVSLTDLIAQAEEIHIGDTLALADLADPVKTTGGTSWTQPVTDTVALADAVRFDRAFTVTDTVALSDGQAFQRDVSQAVTDAVALADLLQLGRGLTVTDVLTLADLADPVKTTGGVALTQPVTDTVVLADALASQAVFARTVTDTVTMSDLVAAVRGIERALADTLTLADAVRLGRGLGLADTATVVDAFVFQVAYVRVLADLVTVLDLVDPRLRAAAAVLNLADAIYLGDQAADRVYAGTTQVWP